LSGPIEASGLFLMLVGISLALFALRLRKTPWAAAWDWWATIAVLVAVGVLSWDLAPDGAGYLALGAFVLLIVVPLRIDAAARRASSAGDDRRARRLASIARVFHPAGIVGHRRRTFDAYAAVTKGAQLDDATIEKLGGKRDPAIAEIFRLTALHFAGRPKEIREALTMPARRHRMLRLGFGAVWLRVVARTGTAPEIVDAVNEIEKWDTTLADPERRAMIAFEACSALGDVEGVEAMLPAMARRSPRGSSEAVLAWAQLVAGDVARARGTIDAALAREPHARGRRALEDVRAAIDHPPARTPSPEADALIARMRREAAAAEALAPLRGARGGRAPVITWAIVAACAIMWMIVERAHGGSENEQRLKDFGALVVPLGGQWWRVFSSAFLHAGFLHMFFNSVGLLIFGRFVEPFYGRLRFLAIYVFATIASALVVLFTLPDGTLLVGASGAIMGVGGAAVAAIAMRKDLRSSRHGRAELRNFALIFGLQMCIDKIIPAISGRAHIAGFLGGALVGAILVPKSKA
jgi:membrane associated rhomboid family serine protease